MRQSRRNAVRRGLAIAIRPPATDHGREDAGGDRGVRPNHAEIGRHPSDLPHGLLRRGGVGWIRDDLRDPEPQGPHEGDPSAVVMPVVDQTMPSLAAPSRSATWDAMARVPRAVIY